MKKYFLLISLNFLFSFLFSQAPMLLKYQAVIRDINGSPLESQAKTILVEILKGSTTGSSIFSESHSIITSNTGIANLNIGSVNTSGFAMVDWSAGPYFLKITVDGQLMGVSQLVSVPYALYSNKTNTEAKFEITGNNNLPADSALFQVKDRNGNVVFAVYEDGAELILNNNLKGSRGGFVVGGRSLNKGDSFDEIMRISQDSIRFYIDNSASKGSRGGFSVGGRNITKGTHPQYLRVTQDSLRIYTTDSIAGFGVASLNGTSTSSYMHLNPNNYFIGQNAGEKITAGKTTGDTAKYNCTMGYQTGMHLTTGMRNVFIGYQAGYLNTTGSYNTANGNLALTNNISGTINCAIGESALCSNTVGSSNVAVGTAALQLNSIGNYNVAMGSFTLANSTHAEGNVAIGNYALMYDTASYNTAVGAVALEYNTSGTSVTAFGNSALRNNTTGSYLTAVGNNALKNNINGDETTAVGQQALYNNISGSQNSAFGAYALDNNTTGSYNTAIGHSANVASSNLSNSTAIGYGAIVNSSNKVVIGNANVTDIGGYAVWTNYSDYRLKENIIYRNDLGLNFINKLHTVSFTYKADKNKHRRDGLIAQDVQKALQELELNFSGLVVDSDSVNTLNLSYSEFVIPLINAVQELSKQNEELQKQYELQKVKNNLLEKDINEIKEILNQKARNSN